MVMQCNTIVTAEPYPTKIDVLLLW